MDRFSKYLRLVRWARNRYTVEGWMIISSCGIPSTYSRIEAGAWNKYLAA